MTDYAIISKRPFWKRFLIRLFSIRVINWPIARGLRRFTADRRRSLFPVVEPESCLILESGYRLYLVDPSRCSIARELWWHNGVLENRADQLALSLAIRLSVEAELFLDVGSYSGMFALAVAKCNPTVRSIAFEIVPQNFLLIWQNILRNDLVAQVEGRFLGVGDTPGSIRVPSTFGDGVLPSSVALDSLSESGVSVPIAPLDLILRDESKTLVMKIDVEGFEDAVLRGASDIVRRLRPDIICEFLTRTESIPEIMEMLRPLGYRFFRITAEGLQHADVIKPVKQERDWLLTTRTDLSHFELDPIA